MARGQIEDGDAEMAETTFLAVKDRGCWHDVVPVAMLDKPIVTTVVATQSLMILYGTCDQQRFYKCMCVLCVVHACMCVCYRCEVAHDQPVDPNLC